jgi:hypothetical protein
MRKKERFGCIHAPVANPKFMCMSPTPEVIRTLVRQTDEKIREGRFQHSLSLVAGLSSVLSTAEVAYEHARGSYGQRIMYTPILLGAVLSITGIAGAFSRWVARTVLRWVSLVTLIDGLVGFGFHLRGIQRKPGGWRLPVTNVIMGPPIFAPILFGVSAYLGLMASYLEPEEGDLGSRTLRLLFPSIESGDVMGRAWDLDLSHGRFQKHLAVVTAIGTFCSGVEALYSHYKNNFRYKAQWTPIFLTPLLMGAALASIKNPKVARTWLPLLSAAAVVDGVIGFYYHARGVLRRPGGIKKPLYNITYGPPIFAPLLFAACGSLGILAALMRRER